MKKGILLLAAALVLICGCERNELPPDIAETNKIERVFSDEDVIAFDFDENGKVRYLTFGKTSEFEEYSFSDGEPIYRLRLSAEDKSEDPCVLDEENGPANMCADGDIVYYPSYIREDHAESVALLRYSLKDHTKEKLHTYRNITLVKKMILADNKIFMLALDPANFGVGETGNGYYNSGEILTCFDLAENTESVIWDKGAVEFGVWESTLVIYAHDADGYFFVTYDAATGDYSEKKRDDLGMIFSFAMCGEDRYVYSAVENSYNNSCVTMGSLTEKGRLDIPISEVGAGGNIKFSNGRLCFIDAAPQSATFGQLIIADISAALNADLSKFLSLASTEILSLVPGSLGFSLVAEQLEPEEFALALLSQDSDRDLFLFTSQDGFSQNAKNKGSFYPLNDIDGVEEYLNDCFPFIRDAMTDENGNVWALPVSLRVNALCYDSETSEQCGLNFSDNMQPDEFTEALLKAQASGLTCFIDPNYYSSLLIDGYLSRNTSFDTVSFRELAEFIKTRIFKNEAFDMSGGSAAEAAFKRFGAALADGRLEDIAFEIICYQSDFSRYSEFPYKKLAPVPGFYGNNSAVCTFICVNPFAENLQDALDYISLLAKTLHNDEENLCVSERSVYETSEYYSELKSVINNGSIVFNCPNEVYANAFYDYIGDKMTLDEFIAEADRKLSAYLNE